MPLSQHFRMEGCGRFLRSPHRKAGAAPRGGLEEQSPPLSTKVIFVNRLKPIRNFWVYERRMTSPTILEFQLEFVTSGFQRPDLTYILFNC